VKVKPFQSISVDDDKLVLATVLSKKVTRLQRPKRK
jgi:hypothetical protein